MMDITNDSYREMCRKATDLKNGWRKTWPPVQCQLSDLTPKPKTQTESTFAFMTMLALGCFMQESLEESLLLYVMFVKFNKLWNGNEWVDA